MKAWGLLGEWGGSLSPSPQLSFDYKNVTHLILGAEPPLSQASYINKYTSFSHKRPILINILFYFFILFIFNKYTSCLVLCLSLNSFCAETWVSCLSKLRHQVSDSSYKTVGSGPNLGCTFAPVPSFALWPGLLLSICGLKVILCRGMWLPFACSRSLSLSRGPLGATPSLLSF